MSSIEILPQRSTSWLVSVAVFSRPASARFVRRTANMSGIPAVVAPTGKQSVARPLRFFFLIFSMGRAVCSACGAAVVCRGPTFVAQSLALGRF